MYNATLGRFINRDPIEADMNLYRYCGNDPLGATDPDGLVTLNLDPTTADSMGWEEVRLSGNRAGNTKVEVADDPVPQVFRNKVTGKCMVRYALKMKATIQLDPANIKKDKKLTPATAYGHEQRHVENAITIMKEAQRRLATVEGKLYDSPREAKEAGDRYITKALNWIRRKLADDRNHAGTDPKSPAAGTGYPPIGTMPDATSP